jgi:hypothetical protein
MWDTVSHLDVCNRNWVQHGASVWVLRPDFEVSERVTEADRLSQGEVLSFRVGDIALRLWTRGQRSPLTPRGGLRLSIKSAGPILVGEVPAIDLPTVGTTFWVRPPVTWRAHERRRAFRVPVHTYAQVWLEGEEEPLVRRVIDLSVTGCALEGVPARVGESVRLTIELAPVTPSLTLQARVVRQDSAALGAYSGLEFQADKAAQDVLLQYLLHVSARHLMSALRR